MQLAENIRNYYFAHSTELTDEKQFHLYSRLTAWSGDEQAIEGLKKLKVSYVPTPYTKEALTLELRRIIKKPPMMSVNAAALRNVYLERYPWLRGLELGLFKVRHLKAVYGIDARPALFDIISRQELIARKNELLADTEAMRTLSTYAINYIYVLERQILENNGPGSINVEGLYELGAGYNPADTVHLQLFIYLYTHCIIAESGFYTNEIPQKYLRTYTKMLRTLEHLIQSRYQSLSLDTKLEFLVCCRICNYDTPLQQTIYDECEKSLSPDGTFLVDTVNAFAAKNRKRTFDESEHRNVLFIMSTSPYQPHQITV